MDSILEGVIVFIFFVGAGLVTIGMFFDYRYKTVLSKRLLALKCRYNGYVTMNLCLFLLYGIVLEKHLDIAYAWLLLMDTLAPLPVVISLVIFMSYFHQRDLLMSSFSRKENN